jgi:hypothetical protein
MRARVAEKWPDASLAAKSVPAASRNIVTRYIARVSGWPAIRK